MLAVIKTGGKQYLVSPGDKIKIEKIGEPTSAKAPAGEVIFDQVLLLEEKEKLEIGTPLVKGAKVVAKIIKQGKDKKVIILKYKAKTRYKVKRGHRQPFTEVEIIKIEKI